MLSSPLLAPHRSRLADLMRMSQRTDRFVVRGCRDRCGFRDRRCTRDATRVGVLFHTAARRLYLLSYHAHSVDGRGRAFDGFSLLYAFVGPVS